MKAINNYLEETYGKERVLSFVKEFGQVAAAQEFKRPNTLGLDLIRFRKCLGLKEWAGDENYGMQGRCRVVFTPDDKTLIQEFMVELGSFMAKVSELLARHTSEGDARWEEEMRTKRWMVAQINYYQRTTEVEGERMPVLLREG